MASTTDPREPPETGLDRLNPVERQVLELLAEGHTAKSIADLTGRSVAAINERLREARRKTGIGSSRELARLFAAAQKNRDEEIDLAVLPQWQPIPDPEAGIVARRWKGAMVMISILIGGVAAALVAVQPERGADHLVHTHVPADPMILGAMPGMPDVHDFHDLVRREVRDTPWADRMEDALRSTYSAIPHMNDNGQVRVICGSSICEVANILPDKAHLTREESDAFYRSLAADPAFAKLQNIGLKIQISRFGSSNTAPPHGLFVAYWTRWQDKAAPDALLDGSLNPDERGARRLYAQIRDEVRDRAWADQTEAGLRKALGDLPALQGPDHRLVARCSLSLCEVSATTSPNPTAPQTESFLRDLQSKPYDEAIARLGLEHMMSSFPHVPGTNRGLYFGYYRRVGS